MTKEMRGTGTFTAWRLNVKRYVPREREKKEIKMLKKETDEMIEG